MAYPKTMQQTTILDYWKVIRNYRWFIVNLVLASVLVTGLVSKFFLPRLYESMATFLPGRQEMGAGGLSFGGDKDKGGGGSASMVLEAAGGRAGPSQLDVLQAILNSRTLAEAVVSELNLMEYYGTKSLAQTVAALRGEVTIRVIRNKFEIVAITHDPNMAATLANAYVSTLDRLNKEAGITSTRRNRIFIEKRLEEKTRSLDLAEEALKSFQTKNRTMVITEAATSAMQTVADLHGQIVGLEVDLAALKEYATPSHPMINQLQVKIKELRAELDRMEKDQEASIRVRDRTARSLSKSAFPPIEEAPTLALDLLRLTRQVKVQEAVYGMLVGMLEQAKIAESKDLPTIQIIDPAIPPEYRSYPRTIQNIEVAAMLALALGILLAFLMEYMKKIKLQDFSALEHEQSGNHVEVDLNGNGSKAEKHSPAPREREHLPGRT